MICIRFPVMTVVGGRPLRKVRAAVFWTAMAVAASRPAAIVTAPSCCSNGAAASATIMKTASSAASAIRMWADASCERRSWWIRYRRVATAAAMKAGMARSLSSKPE